MPFSGRIFNGKYNCRFMTPYEKLLSDNKAWANNQLQTNPDFFNRLSSIQTPDFLWIGCSDSRVPA
ncbi:MAG TPA: hypothetical protein PLY26_11595, partial [Ferruginibacter sp.]|nr:hypothetical protein [Ferruginibacter sp.]